VGVVAVLGWPPNRGALLPLGLQAELSIPKQLNSTPRPDNRALASGKGLRAAKACSTLLAGVSGWVRPADSGGDQGAQQLPAGPSWFHHQRFRRVARIAQFNN